MYLPHAILAALLTLLLLPSQASASTPLQDGSTLQDEGPLVLEDLDFESAVSRAERLKKFLVILWIDRADSPGEAGLMKSVFEDSGVKAWIDKNAVAVRINTKKDRDGARRNPLKRYPGIDILDFARGGRVGRLTAEDQGADFLATVYGATSESGVADKPEGESAKEPFRWLAWANTRYRAIEPQGRKDAVNGYTWCLRRADDFRPGFRSRYLEFLLERISSAKMDAPEAVSILLTESNILAQQMLDGLGSRQTAYDFVRVNKWRRKDLETRDLFLELAGRGPRQEAARRWLLPTAIPVLGRYQQYDDLLEEVASEATAIFASRIASLRAAAGATPAAEAEAPPEGTDGPEVIVPLAFSVPDSRAQIIEEASWVYEALLANGRGADARELFELIQGAYPVPKTFGLFMERAIRLKLWLLVAEIGDIGMGTLDARGQMRIQRLLAKIPPPTAGADDDR